MEILFSASGNRVPRHGRKGKPQDEMRVKLGRMEAKKLLVFSIPLDLNQATMEDLCLISGVGESLAQRDHCLPGKERSVSIGGRVEGGERHWG